MEETARSYFFLAAGRNFYSFYEVSDVTLFERLKMR